MKQPRLTYRTLCVLLAFTITFASLLGGCIIAQAESPAAEAAAEAAAPLEEIPASDKAEPSSGSKKSETVYVTLDPTGKPYDTIVTDWLHSDTPNAALDDRSDLVGIQNIKGEQAPVQDGENLRWQLQGNDLYYQGTSEKPLPLEVKLTYALDGVESDPQSLAGKSGKLAITLRFRNTAPKVVEVNGKKSVLYTPLMVTAGMSLPDDTFHNVAVSDGTVLADGNQQLVAVVCLPGMADSLGLGGYSLPEINDLELPEEFVITADVTNFHLGPIMIAATPELPDLDDLKKSKEFDDMRQDLDDLRGMQNDLEWMDSDRDIRSLLTDPARTDAARVIVSDVFEFYDLNKDILDILPNYITPQNIRLYDRITHDVTDSSLNTLLDEDAIGGLFDLVDDLQLARLQELADDFQALSKSTNVKQLYRTVDTLFSSPDTAKMLTAAQTAQKNLADLKVAKPTDYENAMKMLNYIIENSPKSASAPHSGGRSVPSAELEAQARRILIGYINNPDKAEELAAVLEKSKLNPSLQAELIRASQSEELVDPQHFRSTSHPDDPKPTEPPVVTPPVVAPPVVEPPVVTPPVVAPPVVAPPVVAPPADQNPAPIAPNSDLARAVVSVLSATAEGEPVPTDPAPTEPAPVEPVPSEPAPTEPAPTEPAPVIPEKVPDAERADAYQEITQRSTGYYVMIGAIDSYLSGCSAEELETIVAKSPMAKNGTAPTAPTAEDQLNAVKALIGAMGVQNVQTLLGGAPQLEQAMTAIAGQLKGAPEIDKVATDLMENGDNLETLVLLLQKLDETHLLKEIKNIDNLRDDLSDARPIVKALRRDLKRTEMNRSLHASPETINSVLKMKDDLEANRDIMETMQNLLQTEKVGLSRKMIATLDRLEAKGAVDSATDKLDDLDELLARKDRFVELSDQYGVFSSAPAGVETDVKFVMKTDEVKLPEPAEPVEAPVEKKAGFGDWLKGLVAKKD